MRIGKLGTYVKIKYTVHLESGEILKGDPQDSLAYMEFITGFDQILPGLEKRLLGLNQGEEVALTIPPEEAFGIYDPGLVQEKSYAEFTQGKSLEAGKWVLAENAQYRIKCGYYVKEKGMDSITLDYNHPFAGKSLMYQIKITEARPASQEELEMVRPCDFEAGSRRKVISADIGTEPGQEERHES